MKRKFSHEFKIKAVEKALNRDENTTLLTISESLGIGQSTLGKWLIKAKNNELTISSSKGINKEKRPQDLTLKERFDLVLKCASLNDTQVSRICREQGLYPHHIKQWELDFVSSKNNNAGASSNQSEVKEMKKTIKKLERELKRKDKALAEAAALLVLQKKVQDIWGENEDN